MITVTAINKVYQARIKRFISWDEKYNAEINRLDGDESRRAENCYEKASDLWNELPKREQKNINKSLDTTGY